MKSLKNKCNIFKFIIYLVIIKSIIVIIHLNYVLLDKETKHFAKYTYYKS